MADYPMDTVKQSVGDLGLTGKVIDSNVESTPVETETVRSGSKPNKKSAGHVGASNVNAA